MKSTILTCLVVMLTCSSAVKSENRKSVLQDSTHCKHHPDISYVLEGKYSGVYVKETSSTFGMAPDIKIRGKNFIFGNQQPLWVVDGIKLHSLTDLYNINRNRVVSVFTSSVAGINPENIESIQILKDISETSIYGLEGRNGVILITTKKGKKGKLRVNYTGKLSFNRKMNIDKFDRMDSREEIEFYQELHQKGWLDHSTQNRAEYGVFGKMYADISSNVLNQEETDVYLEKYSRHNTDWFDVLFKNNTTYQHTIDLSASNGKTSFFASCSDFTDNGFALGQEVKRNTVNANVQQSIGKRVNFYASLSASWRDQEVPVINPFMYASTTSRAMRPYTDNGELEYYRKYYTPFNIINELENNYDKVEANDFWWQIGGEAWLLKNLVFAASFSEQKIDTDANLHIGKEITSSSYNVKQQSEKERITNTYLRGSLKWNPFNPVHNLTLQLGAEFNKRKRDWGYLKIIKPVLGSFFEGRKYNNDQIQFWLNANYGYKNLLFFNGTYVMADPNSFKNWQLSSKLKMIESKEQEGLNYFAAKIAYGENERSEDIYILGNTYKEIISLNTDSQFSKPIGQFDIDLEEISEVNLGVEWALFNNRIIGEICYYNKEIENSNILNLEGATGYRYRFVRGKLERKGIDARISFLPIKTNHFSWRTNWNISRMKSKFKGSYDNLMHNTSIATDKLAGELYAPRFAGLDSEGLPMFYDKEDKILEFSDYKQTDSNDLLSYIGTTEPKLFGGFWNQFKYKYFSLDIGLTYAFGNKIKLKSDYPYYNTDANSLPSDLNRRWKQSGDEKKTDIPAVYDIRQVADMESDLSLAYAYYNNSDRSIAKVDFIRLNHICLAYQIPQSKLQKALIHSAQISLQANNLCLLYSDSKLKGIDPEFNQEGGVGLPVPKSYTFTIKLGF